MNTTEFQYSRRLERLKREGKIEGHEYEGETLTLTPKIENECGPDIQPTEYTPDFVVWRMDGDKEYHEVKIVMSNGRTRWQGCSRQKFIDAAACPQHAFVSAALCQDGESWRFEELNRKSATITPEERKAGRSGVHALVAKCGRVSSRHGRRSRGSSEQPCGGARASFRRRYVCRTRGASSSRSSIVSRTRLPTTREPATRD